MTCDYLIVEEVDEENRLVYRWATFAEEPSRVEIELTPTDEGTRISISESPIEVRAEASLDLSMSDDISVVFAALSDPTRRRLFERLLEYPLGRTATELADGAIVSRQAIVKHLQLLANAGLAQSSRDGREVRYRASTGAAQQASTWLSVRASAWDRRLEALEKKVRDAQRSSLAVVATSLRWRPRRIVEHSSEENRAS